MMYLASIQMYHRFICFSASFWHFCERQCCSTISGYYSTSCGDMCIRQLPHIKSYCIGHGHSMTWMGCVWGRQRQRRTPKWFSIQYSMSGIPSSLCSSLSFSFLLNWYEHIVAGYGLLLLLVLHTRRIYYYYCYSPARNRKEKKNARDEDEGGQKAYEKCWYSWRRRREREEEIQRTKTKKGYFDSVRRRRDLTLLCSRSHSLQMSCPTRFRVHRCVCMVYAVLCTYGTHRMEIQNENYVQASPLLLLFSSSLSASMGAS